MATKKELEDAMVKVNMLFDDDCGIFRRFDGIDARLDKYNGNIGKALLSIEETNTKIAKTTEIASAAEKNASNCRKYIDKLTVAVIGSAASAVIALIIALVNR